MTQTNWQTKTLGEICDIFNGSTPLRSKKEYWEDGKVNWFTIKDMRSQGRKIKYTEQKITTKALNENSLKLLPPKTVLICCTASVGEWAISEIELTTNQQFNGMIVKDKNELIPKYLFYFSSTLKDQLLFVSGKTTIDFVSMVKLKAIQIPLPPLPEQKRIVKILDKSFEAITKAKESAEKNLANSKELFESYLQSVFENPSDDWEEKKLGDKELLQIIDGDRGKNYPKKSDFFSKEYCLFLNTKNVRPDGFDFKTTMFITQKKDLILGKGKIRRNDVIMTTRGTIGNLGLYNDDVKYSNIRINSGMLIFRPNLKLILPEYLFEILRSGIIKAQIKKYVSGAAQPQLPIRTLINFSIPFPKSLSTQKTIVKKLDTLSEQSKKLESIYQQKLTDLDELKKSILQKAFAGEL